MNRVMTIEYVTGDILTSKEDFIIQQCNCVSTITKGLSKTLSDVIKCDPYSKRRAGDKNLAVLEDRPIPGSIEILTSPVTNQKVICMYAQYGIGSPYSVEKTQVDDYTIRLSWFKECLQKVADLNPESLAFPFNIGCGFSGGNWEADYLPAIQQFSEKYPDIKIYIYKLKN